MEKRYQVFVSSTYVDLKDERRSVIETLMKVDCTPAGMELFPASDEEQFNFIKRVIDDCDYYLVIIGGRYGSVTPEGISYTEQEYDYALQRHLKVVALLHGAPGDLPAKHTEKTEEGQRRLEAFRQKVLTGRLVDFWTKTEELPGKVALAMLNVIRTFSAVGWIRANRSASEEVLADINELRKENQQLRAELAKHTVHIADLAELDEDFGMRIAYQEAGASHSSLPHLTTQLSASWEWMFAQIAPLLPNTPNESFIGASLAKSLAPDVTNPAIVEFDLQTIRVQFLALGLIDVFQTQTQRGDMALFWRATEKGHVLGLQLRAIRSARGVS